MTAKEYFNKIRNAICGRRSLHKHLSDLEANLTAVGGFDYSKDRVQTSPRNTQEEKICEYIDTQNKYLKMMNLYANDILEAEERLNRLSKSEYAEILRYLHMNGQRLSYYEISKRMEYSEDRIKHLVSEAYTEFEERWLND
jgi:hypothetical protein